MDGHAREDQWLGVTATDRTCLIMDEVNGMSADDRGGVGALNAVIKKTRIPIIFVANDAGAQKLRPLTVHDVRVVIQDMDNSKDEDSSNVIEQLIEGAQPDIRQVLRIVDLAVVERYDDL
ncbi:hypothetical protein F5141DRAFT_732726 [Pisolithus sp. B1]|nr:hypothetical protein F5141DRAFT_732726 [Pisolithus sp. B1]